ncbi:hypothetical protein [Hymenobacter sp. PAMC 26628]|uniref:hypothetical protein n=1 Tax=Hymenobacter sp. PAMC 26628 TaxID=1484118 RepID=UPI0012FFA721|nr:hypothetical protein [Hymenobacter sp. PAMC 26628]
MKAPLLTAAALLLGSAARAQTSPLFVLSAEPTNASVEETLFPQLDAQRHLDIRTARTGQAAVRLAAQPVPATLASRLVPVRQGQVLDLTVYAHYASTAPHKWLVPAAEALAAGLVLSAVPAVHTTPGDRPVANNRRLLPIAGVGLALAAPRWLRPAQPGQPLAYVQ